MRSVRERPMGQVGAEKRPRELRRSPRHRVQYLAHVDPDGSGVPFCCIINDISLGGAKLTISEPNRLPEEFTLIFRRRCRVVHRADGHFGVQFIPGP